MNAPMKDRMNLPTRGFLQRWLPLAAIAALPLLFSTLGTNNGCGHHDTALLGEQCTQNDDCAGQSVCTFANTCHDFCNKASDCPGTQDCVNAGSKTLQQYCACTPAEAPSCPDGCPSGTFCHPDYHACVPTIQDAGACSGYDGGDCLDPNWQACRPNGTCGLPGAYSDGGPGGYCPSTTGGTTSGGTTTGGTTTGGATTGGSTTGAATTGGATTGGATTGGGSTSGGSTTGGATTGGGTTGGSSTGGTTGGSCWPPGHDCPAGPTPLCCSGVCLTDAMCQ
jgi:hypothetical protein